MKKVCLLFVSLMCIMLLCSCKNEPEYDPESIIRNTCFDEYHSFSSGYENFKEKNFGYIVAKLSKGSFVFTSSDDGKWLWEETWMFNNGIPWFDEIIKSYPYDETDEDLVCVTLSTTHGQDFTYSCVFSVNKSSMKAIPILYFSTKDGEIIGDFSIGAKQAIDGFYMMTKYMILDVEQLKETVYGMYN